MPTVTLTPGTLTRADDTGSPNLDPSLHERVELVGTGPVWADGTDDTGTHWSPFGGSTDAAVDDKHPDRVGYTFVPGIYGAPLPAMGMAIGDTINSVTLRVRGWWSDGNEQPYVRAYLATGFFADTLTYTSTTIPVRHAFSPFGDDATFGNAVYWDEDDLHLSGAGWGYDTDGIYQGVPGWTTQEAIFTTLDASGDPMTPAHLTALFRQTDSTQVGTDLLPWCLFIMGYSSNTNELQGFWIYEAEVIVDYTELIPTSVSSLLASDLLGTGARFL